MTPNADTIGQAFINGVVDRAEHGLLRREQLYRRTVLHRVAWRVGWGFADALTTAPLRTASKRKMSRAS